VTATVSNRMGCFAAAVGLALLAACGGGDGGGSPAGPSPITGSPGPSGATITIGANGAITPTQVTIAAGQSVTFVNNHNTSHDMTSNPHPTHTDCPQLNAVGRINAGQTKLTNAFTTARTCGLHDYDAPTLTSLQGGIVIQ